MSAISSRDSRWLKRAFIIPDNGAESEHVARRYFSTASIKFTDTSLGGNTVINPPYQFTEAADIPIPGLFAGKGQDPIVVGQGPYFSEALDDNMQQVHCRMGVPAHNSLTRFFGNLYDNDMGRLARTGRTFDPAFLLGRAAGFVVSIVFWPIMAIQMAMAGVRMLMGHPTTKFYYLKPTMPLYWNAVTHIVNQISVNKGVIPRIMTNSNEQGQMGEKKYGFTKEEIKSLSDILPDIFSEDGTINVYAVANRAHRLARQMHLRMERAFDKSDATLLSALKEIYETPVRDKPAPPLKTESSDAGSVQNQSYLDLYYYSGRGNRSDQLANAANGQVNTDVSDLTIGEATAQQNASAGGTASADGRVGPNAQVDSNSEKAFFKQTGRENLGEFETVLEPVLDETGNETDASKGYREGVFKRTKDFFIAEMDHGAAFFSFRPDYAGPIGESFSNSFGESEIQRKINDMSSSARSARFNFADGNVTGLLSGVVDAAKGFIGGALNQFHVQGLAVLAGNAFVDIPQVWESATAQLPTASYTVRLGGPYGNPISQLMDIDIPLACFMAMALPRATGPQSYTSPFLLEFYDRGRAQSRLAAVSSFSVQRGVGNLGFAQDWRALAVEITITLMPLDSIVAMPITTGFSINPAKIMFTEDTAFTDYLNVLSGMGLHDQIYFLNKWKLNVTRGLQNFDTFFSAAHFAQFASNLPLISQVGQVLRGTKLLGLNGTIRN